ncbi:MAG: DoxX family membrane protein [Roseiflexaceae bacterium]|nr:DoxX family membrane protein [Roseiflexaceae bacterium]
MKTMNKPRTRLITGLVFIVAGFNHFWQPHVYRAIMPPYLPWQRELVAVSGYAEIVLGAMLLIPRLRRWAGAGLVALLLAVFPANLHMALNPGRFALIPVALLWLRLPLQAVLIAGVAWCSDLWPGRATRRPKRAS